MSQIIEASLLLGSSLEPSAVCALRIFLCNHNFNSFEPVCGNAIESNSQPITDCSLITYNAFTNNPYSTLMPCTGDSGEYCGGPDLIAIYTLPGTGLVPLIPFDSGLDGFCGSGNCVGST